MLARTHEFLRRLGKADMSFYLLLPLMALLFTGTVAQKYIGLYAAQKMFFASWLLWIGPLPLPSGLFVMSAFSLSLACKFILCSTWRFEKSGIHLSHLGVLVLLFGGLITSLYARENYMILAEGQQSAALYEYEDGNNNTLNPVASASLPFSLKLQDFKKISYPGTDKAKEYISELNIIDGDTAWPVRISMNQPLRYKGYTFYQSSFEQSELGERSILFVVENKARLFPYIGSALIALGLLLHIYIRMRINQNIRDGVIKKGKS